ncbi:MAG: hypothetical protein H7A43_02060 [Verrucomicrobia bacterium]|nr:hypothetical protein [Verrucomicrobiota bacterium]
MISMPDFRLITRQRSLMMTDMGIFGKGSMLVGFCLILTARSIGATEGEFKGLEAEVMRGHHLVETLSLADYLGPMAPVALSPFFGLACLSGASLLMEKGLLPQHPLLSGHPMLTHPGVLAGLLFLTLFTSLPRLTKVSKPIAQLADFLETYAGFILLILLQQTGTSTGTAATTTTFLTAGIGGHTTELLLMAAGFLNFIVIQTVRFFFECLIFLTPVPLIDAIFEAANKLMCLVLVSLYVFHPFAAMAANLLLFVLCALLFRWAHRRVIYYRHVLLYPIAYKVGAAFHTGEPTPPPADPAPVVFPLRAVGTIRKYAKCRLIKRDHDTVLRFDPWLGRTREEPIPDRSIAEATFSRDLLGPLLHIPAETPTALKVRINRKDCPAITRQWGLREYT